MPRFMVPMHAPTRMGALHEPVLAKRLATILPRPATNERGEGRGEGLSSRFMVPMHAQTRTAATHEPPAQSFADNPPTRHRGAMQDGSRGSQRSGDPR